DMHSEGDRVPLAGWRTLHATMDPANHSFRVEQSSPPAAHDVASIAEHLRPRVEQLEIAIPRQTVSELSRLSDGGAQTSIEMHPPHRPRSASLAGTLAAPLVHAGE